MGVGVGSHGESNSCTKLSYFLSESVWSAKQIGGCGGVCVAVVVRRCRCGEVCVFGRWSGCWELGVERWVW